MLVYNSGAPIKLLQTFRLWSISYAYLVRWALFKQWPLKLDDASHKAPHYCWKWACASI